MHLVANHLSIYTPRLVPSAAQVSTLMALFPVPLVIRSSLHAPCATTVHIACRAREATISLHGHRALLASKQLMAAQLALMELLVLSAIKDTTRMLEEFVRVAVAFMMVVWPVT